jgi:hypothetical protein
MQFYYQSLKAIDLQLAKLQNNAFNFPFGLNRLVYGSNINDLTNGGLYDLQAFLCYEHWYFCFTCICVFH